jgi:fructose-bisphosphate aldolase class I
LENTEEHRRAYRQLLFEISPKSNKYIGGVILYDETVHQKDSHGVSFIKTMQDNGIVPGIKLDIGLVGIPGSSVDQVTQGIDDLHKRVAKYFDLGCRFAKWRAAYGVTDRNPSDQCIELNSSLLARYAAICQAGGLVPIVEPEVLVTEGSHSIQRSYDVTARVLHEQFVHLWKNNVDLSRMLLKPNMIIQGDQCSTKASPKEVAVHTVDILKKTTPSTVPGILFLSGGQSEDESAIHLNEMNKLGSLPWHLSFSYGRALQHSCIKTWNGESKNVEAAQQVFMNKASNCSLASLGKLDKCL